MNRAERRLADKRAKKKAKRKLVAWGFDATPRQIGRNASVHNRGCDCWMCQEHEPRNKVKGARLPPHYMREDDEDA